MITAINVVGVYSGFKIPSLRLVILFARSSIGLTYLAIVAITLFLLKYDCQNLLIKFSKWKRKWKK